MCNTEFFGGLKVNDRIELTVKTFVCGTTLNDTVKVTGVKHGIGRRNNLMGLSLETSTGKNVRVIVSPMDKINCI